MQYINGYICTCLALFFISGCIRLPEYHILQFHASCFIKVLVVAGEQNRLHMYTLKKLALVICIILSMNACAPLRTPVIVKNSPIEMFKYVYISPTKELTSSTGSTYGGQYGIYGSSTTKSVNPCDVIAGILIQKGYVILPELNPELAKETLIVNYGESGRRNRGLGYTIEVTIQFISAYTHEIICSCTAEGQGSTEADDIRQAIMRALDGLFAK